MNTTRLGGEASEGVEMRAKGRNFGQVSWVFGVDVGVDLCEEIRYGSDLKTIRRSFLSCV